jgi:hypothetical protein
VLIEQATYNGPGLMESLVQRVDNGSRIESVAGITISAVPEPSAIVSLSGGLLIAAAGMRRRKAA